MASYIVITQGRVPWTLHDLTGTAQAKANAWAREGLDAGVYRLADGRKLYGAETIQGGGIRVYWMAPEGADEGIIKEEVLP